MGCVQLPRLITEGYTSWPDDNHELLNILKLIKTDHVWAS